MIRMLTAVSVILLLAPFCVTGADLWSDLLRPQHWQSTLKQSSAPAALRSLAMLMFASDRPAESLQYLIACPKNALLTLQ